MDTTAADIPAADDIPTETNEEGRTTLGPIVLRYIGERQRRGEIVPDTVRTIRNHLFHFVDMWGRRPLDQLSFRAVGLWIETMHTAGLAPSTQASRLSSLRCFARWCATTGVTKKDWTLGAPKVRRPRLTPRDVTNEHFAAVLACARTPRERLLVWLMFDAGCRCVEVSRLNVEDVERGRRPQVFLVGKAKNERYVPVTPALVEAVDAYLAGAGHHTGPLIRTEDGQARRLGKERISGMVGRMFRESGVKARPYDGRSAHGLRAAGASDLYEQCDDPLVVQQFLGHADLQNIGRYLRPAQTEKIRRAQMARPHAAAAAAREAAA